jgi:hypothetical protein
VGGAQNTESLPCDHDQEHMEQNKENFQSSSNLAIEDTGMLIHFEFILL